MTEAERRRYWAAVEVPYRPFYAYEETLATFGDPPGSPTSLLAAFETLTGILTDGAVTALPMMDESVRERARLVSVGVPRRSTTRSCFATRRRTPSGPSGWSGCSVRPGCGSWSPRRPWGPPPRRRHAR
ncbi:hypothetical protein NKG94_24610 [Micromonospora sp. M12]